MMLSAVLFDIGRATDAKWLNTIRREVQADETLHSTEKDEACAAIDDRFRFLNSQSRYGGGSANPMANVKTPDQPGGSR